MNSLFTHEPPPDYPNEWNRLSENTALPHADGSVFQCEYCRDVIRYAPTGSF